MSRGGGGGNIAGYWRRQRGEFNWKWISIVKHDRQTIFVMGGVQLEATWQNNRNEWHVATKRNPREYTLRIRDRDTLHLRLAQGKDAVFDRFLCPSLVGSWGVDGEAVLDFRERSDGIFNISRVSQEYFLTMKENPAPFILIPESERLWHSKQLGGHSNIFLSVTHFQDTDSAEIKDELCNLECERIDQPELARKKKPSKVDDGERNDQPELARKKKPSKVDEGEFDAPELTRNSKKKPSKVDDDDIIGRFAGSGRPGIPRPSRETSQSALDRSGRSPDRPVGAGRSPKKVILRSNIERERNNAEIGRPSIVLKSRDEMQSVQNVKKSDSRGRGRGDSRSVHRSRHEVTNGNRSHTGSGDKGYAYDERHGRRSRSRSLRRDKGYAYDNRHGASATYDDHTEATVYEESLQPEVELIVAGGRDDMFGKLKGGYIRSGDFGNRPTFERVMGAPDEELSVFLYFTDDEDKEGWWFGRNPGTADTWAFHPSDSDLPPKTGWVVPGMSKAADETMRVFITSEESTMETKEAEADLWGWLVSLDRGEGGMLRYFNKLAKEYDNVAQLGTLWRAQKGSSERVDPEFFRMLGLTKLGHKFSFLRGIFSLAQTML